MLLLPFKPKLLPLLLVSLPQYQYQYQVEHIYSLVLVINESKKVANLMNWFSESKIYFLMAVNVYDVKFCLKI